MHLSEHWYEERGDIGLAVRSDVKEKELGPCELYSFFIALSLLVALLYLYSAQPPHPLQPSAVSIPMEGYNS